MTNNNDKYVISLYDYTGEALKPWAEAGYQCIAYDIQHDNTVVETFEGGGSIMYKQADLHNMATLDKIHDSFDDLVGHGSVTFAMAFPVCTDMAVSGAAHFKRKRERDPCSNVKPLTMPYGVLNYSKHSTVHTL